MNLSNLIFALSLLLILTACNQEENPPPQETPIGNWKLTNLDIKGFAIHQELDSSNDTFNIVGLGTDLTLEMDFSENPNNYISEGSYGMHYEVVVNGFPASAITHDLSPFGNGNWGKNTGQLSLTNDDTNLSIHAEFEEFSDSEIQLTVTDNQVIISMNGIIEQELVMVYSFEKI